MIKEPQIPQFDLILCLSNTIDLVSSIMVNHHQRVAYIALSIAEELGLSSEEINELVLAGILHDAGALSLQQRMDALSFEIEKPHQHAETGYRLLESFTPLSKEALLIKYHHVPWEEGGGEEFHGEKVPLGSHILHLSDRIDVLIDREEDILGQVKGIYNRIEEQSVKMFMPELVDAFKSLSRKEYFWLDTVSHGITSVLRRNGRLKMVEVSGKALLDLANLFSQIIDFRSHFTASHSSGVSAVSEELARLAGFSPGECRMMKIAGLLHDLGKLAIPTEILEKAGKLTPDEFNVIRSHTFYTYRSLESIRNLELINSWASFHHERLDGQGYPFHISGDDLSLGARIIAVADIFNALTEKRPYRDGSGFNETIGILERMAQSKAIDPYIVSILKSNYDEISSIRAATENTALQKYEKFRVDTDEIV
ncbi:MAG: HD domain-containing phosphohydrolase [bacterium]